MHWQWLGPENLLNEVIIKMSAQAIKMEHSSFLAFKRNCLQATGCISIGSKHLNEFTSRTPKMGSLLGPKNRWPMESGLPKMGSRNFLGNIHMMQGPEIFGCSTFTHACNAVIQSAQGHHQIGTNRWFDLLPCLQKCLQHTLIYKANPYDFGVHF